MVIFIHNILPYGLYHIRIPVINKTNIVSQKFLSEDIILTTSIGIEIVIFLD